MADSIALQQQKIQKTEKHQVSLHGKNVCVGGVLHCGLTKKKILKRLS